MTRLNQVECTSSNCAGLFSAPTYDSNRWIRLAQAHSSDQPLAGSVRLETFAQKYEDLVRQVVYSYDVSETHQGAIWPSFHYSEHPTIVFDGEMVAFLFHYPFAQLPDGYVPLLGYEDVAVNFAPPIYTFVITTTIGEAIGTIVPMTMGPMTLFHESFHSHQELFDFYTPNASVGSAGASFMQDNDFSAAEIALIRLEGVLLAEALQSKTDAFAVQRIRFFLAVRSQRYASTEAIPGIEDMMEASEGTAYYIEKRLRVLGHNAESGQWLHPDPEGVNEIAYQYVSHEGLLAEVEANTRLPLDEMILRRGRHYEMGALAGLILDRFGMSNWTERLEGGETFAKLLAEVSDYDQSQGERFYSMAVASWNHSKQIEEAQAWIDEKKAALAETIKSFEESPGTKVTFTSNHRHAYSSQEPLQLEDGSMLFGESSSVRYQEGPNYVTLAGQMKFLLKSEKEREVTLYIEDLSKKLTLNGKPLNLDVEGSFQGALQIQAGETSVALENASVVVSQDGITIHY